MKAILGPAYVLAHIVLRCLMNWRWRGHGYCAR